MAMLYEKSTLRQTIFKKGTMFYRLEFTVLFLIKNKKQSGNISILWFGRTFDRLMIVFNT